MIREYGWYLVKRITSHEDRILQDGHYVYLGTYTKCTWFYIVEWCKDDGYWAFSADRDDDTVSDKFFEVVRKIEDLPCDIIEKVSKEESEEIIKNVVKS